MKTIRTILICLMFVVPAASAQEVATPSTETTTAAITTAPTGYADSEETRRAFLEVLGKYPPQVSKVLKLDPTLFSNSAYLGNYPALAEFVSRHPQVTHTPAYFLETVWVPSDPTPHTVSERIWEQTMEGIFIFTMVFLVIGTIVWLIRTLIEHRRWSRVSRTQVEVHGKLMDRLNSNEDLLAYMQTPAGKRFLESAPIPLDSSPRAVSAPIGRILWSVQVGLIMAMGGFGLQFVSGTIDKNVSQPLLAMGVLAVAVGVGFLLSALVSFLLSKRLGLLVESTPAE